MRFERQYTTGAGWRVVGYRCQACGYRASADATTQAATVVGAAALAAAVAAAVKRWVS
ncbi:hypothetical protein GCM10009039_32640 [Halocalculus aciditolerans]|uniref:Uncharacterized protein n=1 Tax=Halocalculus aciditolerans TaxID=1383812 RepID=A0A830FGG0_9EURY|nr:hypothetical protein GCM10009039_32640 [Halocalculus aciditolerans]